MDLYYQIANCAFVEGHIMPAESEHARHTVIDICQDGNRDRVDALIQVALDILGVSMETALASPLACEYIVCRVMEDWLDITKPEAAPRWRAKAKAALIAYQSSQRSGCFTRGYDFESRRHTLNLKCIMSPSCTT